MPASSKAKKPKSPDSSVDRLNQLLAEEHAALRSGVSRIAGVDEAGRGPLAGPVVAAAVVFPPEMLRGMPAPFTELNDSKQLRAAQRERLFAALREHPALQIGVGVVTAAEIDRINILRATHMAMARALQVLEPLPELALVDGLPVPGLPCGSKSLVKGDARCLSIAAASVVAKVTRDTMLAALDAEYPQYGFAKHKGYGTAAHLQALQEHGPCPAHRMSFAPVRQLRLF